MHYIFQIKMKELVNEKNDLLNKLTKLEVTILL